MKIQYISITDSLSTSYTVLTKWTLVPREVQKFQNNVHVCSFYLFIVFCLKYSF